MLCQLPVLKQLLSELFSDLAAVFVRFAMQLVAMQSRKRACESDLSPGLVGDATGDDSDAKSRPVRTTFLARRPPESSHLYPTVFERCWLGNFIGKSNNGASVLRCLNVLCCLNVFDLNVVLI